MVKNKLRIIKVLFATVVLLFFGLGSINAQSVSLSLPNNITGQTGQSVSIPVTINTGSTTVINYNLKIAYNPAVVVIDTIDCTGTLAAGSISNKNASDISIGFANLAGFTGNGTLLYLKGHTVAPGTSTLSVVSGNSSYNQNIAFNVSQVGQITVANLAVNFPTLTAAANIHKGDLVEIPITLSSPINGQSVNAYQFSFTYDATKLSFANNDIITTGTASEGGSGAANFTVSGTTGTGNVSVAINPAISSSSTLLVKLRATAVGRANAGTPLTFNSWTFFTNGGGTLPASTFNGSVVVVGRAPNSLTATPNPATVAEGSLLTIAVNGTDPDGDSLTYSATGLPTGAAFNAATKSFTWTPGYDKASATPYNVTFKVADADSSLSIVVPITVTNTNRVPTAINFTPNQSSYAVNQGVALNIALNGVDPDVAIDDTLTYSFTQGASDPSTIPASALNAATGAFSWTPAFGSQVAGTYTVTFKVTDKAGASITAVKTIVVGSVNNPPSWTVNGAAYMPNVTIREGMSYSYPYKAIDPEGSAVSYLVTTNQNGSPVILSWVSINPSTGLLSIKPPVGSAGTFSISVLASDGVNNSVASPIAVVTILADKAPVVAVSGSQTINVTEETPISFTITTTDADASDSVKLSYTSIAAMTGATVTLDNAAKQGGTFAWTPALGKAGSYSVTFTGTDLSGVAATVTVNITVTKKNYAPVFTAKLPDQTIAAGTVVNFTYQATDANGDALTYSVISPTGATINATTGAFTYTASTPGTISVLVQVTDGTSPVVATSTLTVTGLGISGKAVYANSSAKAVSGIKVSIKKLDGTSAASDVTTDANGAYAFSNLAPATYVLSYTKSTDDWGSVNAADALQIARFFATLDVPSDVQSLASDVNNNGAVNNTDALAVLQRYVGIITSFSKPDWVFKGDVRTKVNLGAAVGDTVVLSSNVINNLSVLATGDANKSLYLTGTAKAIASTLGNSVVKVNAKSSFDLPVTADLVDELGSVSIKLSYPADLAKLTNIVFNSKLKDVVYKTNVSEGTVAIAWMSDLKSDVKLSAKEALFTLKFAGTDKLQNGSSFALTLDPSSEITTSKGVSLDKSGINAPKIDVTVPEVFSLKQNYPNPFNPATTISYDIPTSGHVKLVVMNILGQVVETIVNSVQEAGSYKVQWNASRYSSGVYLYTLTVEGASKNFAKTNRMILMK